MVERYSENRVRPGWLVRVEISYQNECDQLAFVIVPDDQADFSAGFLGEGTPLAQAVLDEPIGTEIPYFAGDARSVRILAIEATDLTPPQDAAARREQKLQDAINQVGRTNAMIFASSFSGKWGDYDPHGIESWDSKDPDSPSSSG